MFPVNISCVARLNLDVTDDELQSLLEERPLLDVLKDDTIRARTKFEIACDYLSDGLVDKWVQSASRWCALYKRRLSMQEAIDMLCVILSMVEVQNED